VSILLSLDTSSGFEDAVIDCDIVFGARSRLRVLALLLVVATPLDLYRVRYINKRNPGGQQTSTIKTN
jgi:hypothetical protein